MFCPYCGTKNDENAAHCINPECNRILPQRQHPGMRPVPAKPTDPLALARTIGGLSGLIGGGMVILGWFMPWLSLSVGGFTLASGGNGPQIVVGILVTGIAGGALGGLAREGGIGLLILCLSLIMVAVVLIVPIFGFLACRNGWRLFSIQSSKESLPITLAIGYLEEIRQRLQVVLILVTVIFVLTSFLSLSALDNGFWLTAIGTLGGFLGASYLKAQLKQQNRL